MTGGLRGTLPAIREKADALADSVRAALAPRADGYRLHERKAEAARDLLVSATTLRDFIVRVDERPQWRDEDFHDELVALHSAMGAAVARLSAVAAEVDGAH